MRTRKVKTSLIFKSIIFSLIVVGSTISVLAQVPTGIEEKVEIKGDLVNKFCINLSEQSYKVIDPRLTGSPGLPVIYTISDSSWVTMKILMDAIEIKKIMDKELLPPGTNIKIWDGKKKNGQFATTGKYRVLLYAKRKADFASCSAILEFYVVRVGMTQLTFKDGLTPASSPLIFHRQTPFTATDYSIPAYEWKIKSLDIDSNTIRPLPMPHDDYPYMGDDDNLTDEDNYNYPIAFVKGSAIKIKMKMASDSEGFRIPVGSPQILVGNPWYTVDKVEINSGYYVEFTPFAPVVPNLVTRDTAFTINIRYYYLDGRIYRYFGQQSTTHILYSTWKEVTDQTYVQIMKWSCQWAPPVQLSDKSFTDHYIQRSILEQTGVQYQFPNSGGIFTTGLFLDQQRGACGNWASFFYDLLASQGINGVGFHHVALGFGSPWENYTECLRVDSVQGINNLVQQLIVSDHVFCNFAGEIYDPSFANHFIGTWEEYVYSLFKLFPIEIDAVNPSIWQACHGATAPNEVYWIEKGAGSNFIRTFDLQAPDPNQYLEQSLRNAEP
ncbi:MAG: hypothetical protein RBG1_1C00001G0086 [candidate division Zixibacteria bacterium RBG-1]|nr:MAG: hypothetical protein RBG1_1C00001G0086 [candidate division Zixibacteria bacterium RBG-1]OGC84020.1 MAG: hypothetical protein A2V73_00035 [candidate division Zixibacteria bacterium RBG_19FT_COMBO_42_43]